MRRELAHRRLFVALVRRGLRLVTLHGLDVAALSAAIVAAAWLSTVQEAGTIGLALVAFTLLGLNLNGSYRPGPARHDAIRILGGVFVGVLVGAIPSSLRVDVPGTFLLLFGLCGAVGLIIERHVVDTIVRQAYRRGIGLRRALVVGRPHEAHEIIAGLRTDSSSTGTVEDQLIVGYVTPDEHPTSGALGTISSLSALLDSEHVSELVVGTSLRQSSLAAIGDECFARGVRLFVIPAPAQTLDGWAESTRLGRWSAYHLHPARLELPHLMIKRGTDVLLASLGLLLAAPLMGLIAVVIKAESRGPVFFRQLRVGLGGRPFMMWKFRSMHAEAEARQQEIAHLNPYRDGRLFKLPVDPRITRVGRFLRRFSLDELPQLFNILAGDMSLVGPRPPVPSEVSTYEPHHMIRLSVVPGLTGPWQVNGRNLITEFEEVVRLERVYIETWSWRSDLEIILRTIGVVLSGRGAY